MDLDFHTRGKKVSNIVEALEIFFQGDNPLASGLDVKQIGEAAQIDRLMQAFGHAYCSYLERQNDGWLTPDTCYQLSFSIMILNTDQHNPNHAKSHKKMTQTQFLNNIQRIPEWAALIKQNPVAQTKLKDVYN